MFHVKPLEGVVMIDRKKMTTLLINVISVKMLLTFPKIMIIKQRKCSMDRVYIQYVDCNRTVLDYNQTIQK